MILSKIIFRLTTAWSSLLIGNMIIVGLICFAVYTSLVATSTDMIMDLRCETISTIVIAWGVILESRDLLIRNGHMKGSANLSFETAINLEAERSGLFLVVMGLLLEMTTYFDIDVRTEMLPSSFHTILVWMEWGIVVMVLSEIAATSIRLIRIKLAKGAL